MIHRVDLMDHKAFFNCIKWSTWKADDEHRDCAYCGNLCVRERATAGCDWHRARSAVFQAQTSTVALAYSSNGPSSDFCDFTAAKIVFSFGVAVVDPRQHEVWPHVIYLVAICMSSLTCSCCALRASSKSTFLTFASGDRFVRDCAIAIISRHLVIRPD